MRLTPKQQAVYEFIRASLEGEGRSPTYQEIARRFGWSNQSSAYAIVQALYRKGLVQRTDSPHRYITLAAKPAEDSKRLNELERRGVREIRFSDGWVSYVRRPQELRTVLDDLIEIGGAPR